MFISTSLLKCRFKSVSVMGSICERSYILGTVGDSEHGLPDLESRVEPASAPKSVTVLLPSRLSEHGALFRVERDTKRVISNGFPGTISSIA